MKSRFFEAFFLLLTFALLQHISIGSEIALVPKSLSELFGEPSKQEKLTRLFNACTLGDIVGFAKSYKYFANLDHIQKIYMETCLDLVLLLPDPQKMIHAISTAYSGLLLSDHADPLDDELYDLLYFCILDKSIDPDVWEEFLMDVTSVYKVSVLNYLRRKGLLETLNVYHLRTLTSITWHRPNLELTMYVGYKEELRHYSFN